MSTFFKRTYSFILVFLLIFSGIIISVHASETTDIPAFTTPFSYTENFESAKTPFVGSIGTAEEYSQFVTAKYWSGSNASNISANSGVNFSSSQESLSLSSLQPVKGNYTFDFVLTHPEFNNLSSGVYIGARSTEQFVYLPDYTISSMPTNGVWLGISYNNVFIGTDPVSGSDGIRYTMADSFRNYTHFRIFDDRENNVIYYYAINDETALLFAKAELTFDVSSSSTVINYTIFTGNGEETCEITVPGLLSSDASEEVYPQLHIHKYLCALTSFGVTCEADKTAGLSGIILSGAELSEEPSPEVTDYTLKMPVSGTINLSVEAAPGVKYSVFADSDEVPVLFGENTLTITDKSALYIIADNGISETLYTFTIVDNTHTVTVNPAFCSVDGDSTLVIDYGETAVFTIIPDPGYDFSSVSGDAIYTEETVKTVRTGTLTLENVTENVEIDLVFEPRKAIDLTIGSAVVAQGETFDIPISISADSGTVSGAFNILYDSDRLEFLGPVTTGCLSVGNRNLEPTPVAGKLGFYFISKNLGQTPLTNGGVLIYARFTVKDDATDGEEPITLSFEQNDGSVPSINDWEGPRVVNTTDGVITFLTPDDGKYILKTEVAGGIGGTVTPGTRLGEGEKINLKATATTGYTFSHWKTESGSFSSTTASSSTYTMGSGNVTVYAHFKLKTYVINTAVANNEGGTISSSANIVEYGDNITVTMTPYPGYELSGFTVNGKDKLSSVTDGIYTLSSIKATQTMIVTYSWVGADIIEHITPLRSYDVTYNNNDRTITVLASNKYTSAGFALTIPGDTTTGAYVAESGKNLSQGLKDNVKYIVARRSAGEQQTFELYITYENHEYTYNVTFMFTDDPSNVSVTDFAAANAYSLIPDTINHRLTVTADRYGDSAGFAFVLPETAKMSYEFISASSGNVEVSEVVSSDYITSSGETYGELTFITLPISNGHTQKLKVTVTDGTKSNEYIVTVVFRDLSYDGNVKPSALKALRLSGYSIDTESKVISLETIRGASSAGFSFDMGGNPPTKLTCQSGKGLAYGSLNGYRYIIARKSMGTTQSFKVKLYGNDGYEYSWYTVTIKFN